MGQKCPLISFAFGRQQSMITNNIGQLEIVFQVCQCIRHDCVFWDEQKESCKILVMLDNMIDQTTPERRTTHVIKYKIDKKQDEGRQDG